MGAPSPSGPFRAHQHPPFPVPQSPHGWYSQLPLVPRLPVGNVPGLCTALLVPGFDTRTWGPGHRPGMRQSRQLQ
jgi:hypothetical protein